MVDPVIVVPASTLLGVGAGWLLAHGDRKREERHLLRMREEEAMGRFQSDLVDVLSDLPRHRQTADLIAKKAEAVYAGLMQAGRRAAVVVIADADVERRLGAMLAGLEMLASYASEQVGTLAPDAFGNEGSPAVNPWAITVAADELLEAVVRFQRREEPTPATFPTAEELAGQFSWEDEPANGEGGGPLKGVNRLVRERRRADPR